MVWRPRSALMLLLLAASCEKSKPEERALWESRGTIRVIQQPWITMEPINWQNSAGVFIGLERFRQGNDVLYAADDAIDLAYLFTKELQLPPGRAALLVAGRPNKPSSQKKLDELKAEARVIVEEGDDSQRPENASAMNAGTIYSQIEEQARKVGPDGILILFIASHGVTTKGQQILLTADSSGGAPKGVVLAEMMQAIRFEPGRRLLVLVDACREKLVQGGQKAPGSRGLNRHAAALERFFEDLQMPGGYAILIAAGPGGSALSNEDVRNGFFTSAILEGLRCHASMEPEGFVTLSGLETYVSHRVRELSRGHQQPEGRFGGIGSLSLVRCRPPEPIAEIISPQPNDYVHPRGVVRLRVVQPELFATVLLCAEANGVCYNQSPGASPVLARDTEVMLHVQYGRPDNFKIYVALSADRDFLRGETEISPVPLDRRADRIVYWLSPVNVIFTARPVILSPREGQRLGPAGAPPCLGDPEAPCYRIEAEGHIPEGKTPFFAVEPTLTSPLKRIQPPIHGIESSGSFHSLVYLGEPSIGTHQSYKIYLLACGDRKRFRDGDQLLDFPDDCLVSEPVTVQREF